MRNCEALIKLHIFELHCSSNEKSQPKQNKRRRIFYLIDANVPNSGNMQNAYTEKMRKYAELDTEVKQQWQVEAVYTLSATISAI